MKIILSIILLLILIILPIILNIEALISHPKDYLKACVIPFAIIIPLAIPFWAFDAIKKIVNILKRKSRNHLI